ncbi:MAG TPA: M20/M25/M40 family metallo-hydrolase [Candidatus Acidoferrum sp.]|nr:M20/M25/M40 family metallo-hydrolase [Candidatus Acidoferrum sp.]
MNSHSTHASVIQRAIIALREAARSSDYFYEQVRFLCDSIGPRLSGSPQAAAAVEYVKKQMMDLGFEVKLEPVTVRHWVRGKEEAELTRYPGQVPGTRQKIAVTALGNAPATPPDGITAPVIVVNTFDEFDLLSPARIKNKIVLFNHPFDEFAALAGRAEQSYESAVKYRSQGPARAAERGALAAVIRSVGPSGFRLVHTGTTKYRKGRPQIAAGAVSTEDADLIAALATRGEVEIHLLLTPRDLQPAQSYNVIADLTGSQHPEQIVIVSAHLDSWDLGTGALDDASGLGVAMDVLRIIKEVSPRPARTIRFIAWMNEENGVAGGHAYAEDYKSELPNHVAAIELDYGDGRPLGLKVHSSADKLEPLLGLLHTIGDPVGGVVAVDHSPGVDLGPIDELGVPTIAPLQDTRHYFNYHHTAADTFDKLRIDELRQNLEMTCCLVYTLAQENDKNHTPVRP